MPGHHLTDTFKLRHPYVEIQFEKMLEASNNVFLLKAVIGGLELRGQMLRVPLTDDQLSQGALAANTSTGSRDGVLFMGSPRIANLDDMNCMGLYLSDIPLHDMSR